MKYLLTIVGLILLILLFLAPIIVLMLYIFRVFFRVRNEADDRSKALVAFTEQAGYQYVGSAEQEKLSGSIGAGRQTNYFKGLLPVTHNPFSYTDMELATPGTEDNPGDYQRYGIYKVTVPDTKTHIVVDSQLIGSSIKGDNFLAYSKDLYEAEGDFAKYFNLYIPQRSSVAGLTLLSPDVLERIKQDFGYMDIELINDSLYFYIYDFVDIANMPDTLHKIDLLVDDMVLAQENAKTNSVSVPAISRVATANAKPKILRLSKTPTYITIVTFIAFFLFRDFAFKRYSDLQLGIGIMAVIVTVFGVSVVLIMKQRKLHRDYTQSQKKH